MRLDKYITECTKFSRKEAKDNIRKKRITVNGEIVQKPEYQVLTSDIVKISNEELTYRKYEYFMLNKPAGVVSATTDLHDATVVELLKTDTSKEIFPVGRLDKDTTGLLILTNDGALAHRLLSPKHHVDKKYFVELDGSLTEDDVTEFFKGIDIGEKNKTLPAKLEILTPTTAYITIHEGKFHQIKRMFHERGRVVESLKRVSMGPIFLDDTLQPGEYRQLTVHEVELLKGYNQNEK